MSRWTSDLLAAGLLAALTLLVYLPVLTCGFLAYDDPQYVWRNPHVAGGLTPAGLAYAWTTFDMGNWIPVTWMSYQLDASLFGIRAWAFHGANLWLHTLNVLLLFGWLRTATQTYWRSALAAALFAVHPLHVESVAWVSERKDVLSLFWLLLALLAYTRYARRPGITAYAACLGAYLLGLLSKPMLVTVPILLLLVDFWPLRRWTWERGLGGSAAELRPLLWEKVPPLLAAFAIGMVTVVSQHQAGAIVSQTQLPVVIRIENAIQALTWYVWKTLTPWNLHIGHLPAELSRSAPVVAGEALVLTLISVLTILFARSRPWLAWGWFWFVIALLPVIGLMQAGVQPYADRYVYIPHVGLLTLFAWEAAGWTSRALPLRWAGGALLAAVLAASSVLTWNQTQLWQNDARLWGDVLLRQPHNWLAHYELGCSDFHAGRVPDAERHFQKSLEANPEFDDALVDLAVIYRSQDRAADAVRLLDRALRAAPNHLRALYQRGALARAQGNLPQAVALLTRARDRAPEDVAIRDLLGQVYAQQGQFLLALAEFEAACSMAPDVIEFRQHAALVLVGLKRLPEATARLRQAVILQPADLNVRRDLALLLERQGASREAAEQYQEILKLAPQDADARSRLEALPGSPMNPSR